MLLLLPWLPLYTGAGTTQDGVPRFAVLPSNLPFSIPVTGAFLPRHERRQNTIQKQTSRLVYSSLMLSEQQLHRNAPVYYQRETSLERAHLSHINIDAVASFKFPQSRSTAAELMCHFDQPAQLRYHVQQAPSKLPLTRHRHQRKPLPEIQLQTSGSLVELFLTVQGSALSLKWPNSSKSLRTFSKVALTTPTHGPPSLHLKLPPHHNRRYSLPIVDLSLFYQSSPLGHSQADSDAVLGLKGHKCRAKTPPLSPTHFTNSQGVPLPFPQSGFPERQPLNHAEQVRSSFHLPSRHQLKGQHGLQTSLPTFPLVANHNQSSTIGGTSSYTSRAAALRSSRKLPANNQPVPPNPFPDLMVSGSQFQSLTQVTDLVSSVMEATLTNMEDVLDGAGAHGKPDYSTNNSSEWCMAAMSLITSLLEKSTEDTFGGGYSLGVLKRHSKQLPHGTTYSGGNFLPLLKDSSEGKKLIFVSVYTYWWSNDLIEPSPPVLHDPALATINEIPTPSDESGDEEDLNTIRIAATATDGEVFTTYTSGLPVGGRGNQSLSSMEQRASGYAAGLSQREIVEQRLKKKGIKMYSDEEARKILEQAKSDLHWMQEGGKTPPQEPPGQRAGKKVGHTSKGKRVKGKRGSDGKRPCTQCCYTSPPTLFLPSTHSCQQAYFSG